MPRIPLVDPDAMTPEQREAYDRFPSNLSRALQLAGPRLARSQTESANALRASGLDAALREAVILRVAALQRSAYERMQHLGQAAAAGWDPRQIAAIEAGDLSALPVDTATVLVFAQACVACPEVSDAVFEAVAAVLHPREIVTVVLLVGHYLTIARLTGVLRVELDKTPDPFTHEH